MIFCFSSLKYNSHTQDKNHYFAFQFTNAIYRTVHRSRWGLKLILWNWDSLDWERWEMCDRFLLFLLLVFHKAFILSLNGICQLWFILFAFWLLRLVFDRNCSFWLLLLLLFHLGVGHLMAILTDTNLFFTFRYAHLHCSFVKKHVIDICSYP